MSWMGTQLSSDVPSRPTRSLRSARLPVARLQSAGVGPRDQEIRTRRTPLQGNVHVDYSSNSQSVSGLGSDASLCQNTKMPRQVDSSAIRTPLRHQTRGIHRGLGRLGPTRGTARSARISRRQTTTTAVGLGVCSNRCTHNIPVFFA